MAITSAIKINKTKVAIPTATVAITSATQNVTLISGFNIYH